MRNLTILFRPPRRSLSMYQRPFSMLCPT